MTGIYAILALSLNLQYGFTGLVNLGHVVFFMIGAYVSAILVMIMGLPYPVGLLGGTVTAALFGGLMALPTAHLQQDYWAISSLAAAEIVRIFFLNTELSGPYVGASFGISGIPQPLRDSFESPSVYGWFYLGIVAVALLVCFLFVRWLTGTPYGRALKSIREGDDVPLALGKDARSLRIRAMIVGGALGGLAGALFAHFNAFIDPRYFLPLETFIIWAMIILGGAGNHLGALVGAVIIQALYNSTRFVAERVDFIDAQLTASLRMIVIGLLITAVILFMPRGLLPEPRRRYGVGRASESS
jgi:ABC-type branched-subunit amino acid transport system permease subunit